MKTTFKKLKELSDPDAIYIYKGEFNVGFIKQNKDGVYYIEIRCGEDCDLCHSESMQYINKHGTKISVGGVYVKFNTLDEAKAAAEKYIVLNENSQDYLSQKCRIMRKKEINEKEINGIIAQSANYVESMMKQRGDKFISPLMIEFVENKIKAMTCRQILNSSDVFYVPEGYDILGDQTEKTWRLRIKQLVTESVSFEPDDDGSNDGDPGFDKEDIFSHIDEIYGVYDDPCLDVYEDEKGEKYWSMNFNVHDMERCAENLEKAGYEYEYDGKEQDQENLHEMQGHLNDYFMKSMVRYEYALRILSFQPTKNFEWSELEQRVEDLYNGKIKPKIPNDEKLV